ncbi:MAG: hypothetical protein H0T72_07620 [Chloroflexia bacterium]|nr:hypothetical protein [Chloroflexia bacterium]
MDSLLSGLFGDKDDDTQSRGRAQDFINRYDDGAPHENITDEEALNNYQAVAGRLTPQELEDSAAEAYERMSPDERRAMARFLNDRSDVQFDQLRDDPRGLAQMTSRVQSRQPDGLAGLLGGLGGGGMGGMLSDVLGGDNDRNRQRQGGGGMGDMLQNPIARAALGGIAAMAMRKIIR